MISSVNAFYPNVMFPRSARKWVCATLVEQRTWFTLASETGGAVKLDWQEGGPG